MSKDAIITLIGIAAVAGFILFFLAFQNPSIFTRYPQLFVEMTNEGYLTGIVYGPDGAPFDNFKLIIYSGDVLVTIVHTDADGRYSLPLSVGSYQVVTSQGTYEVTIESDKTTFLNILT